MKTNLPVYDFLGFKLINISYSRNKDNPIEYFAIKTRDKIFEEKTSVFNINLEVCIKFIDDDISKFVFTAKFKINDLDWKNQLNDEILESIFVSVIFPYVRAKIQSVTDDSRGLLNLPIIDLRNISLSEGVKLSPVYANSIENKNK